MKVKMFILPKFYANKTDIIIKKCYLNDILVIEDNKLYHDRLYRIFNNFSTGNILSIIEDYNYFKMSEIIRFIQFFDKNGETLYFEISFDMSKIFQKSEYNKFVEITKNEILKFFKYLKNENERIINYYNVGQYNKKKKYEKEYRFEENI